MIRLLVSDGNGKSLRKAKDKLNVGSKLAERVSEDIKREHPGGGESPVFV
jgi:hypothetical protein